MRSEHNRYSPFKTYHGRGDGSRGDDTREGEGRPCVLGSRGELFPQDRQESDATWSPDGKQIAFGRPSYGLDVGELEIQFFDLTTHQISTVPGSRGMFSPRWSPDGCYLAALTSDSRKLMLFDLTTRQWSDWLSTDDGTIGYPVWTLDSKSIYVERFLAAERSMHKLRLGETQSERFLSWNDLHRFSGIWGAWSGVAPDGSSLCETSARTKSTPWNCSCPSREQRPQLFKNLQRSTLMDQHFGT